MNIKRYILACLSVLVLFCGISEAQQRQENRFPYVARVAGENVNFRAGPGVNHYRCGRLSAPATVVVTGEQFGFARIIPPEGSFSWVAERHIEKIDDNTGTVTSDGVRVWAGSPYVSAIHSSTSQLELNQGDDVKFSGNPESGYYRIEPPEGAHLWISANHIEYVSSLADYEARDPEKKEVKEEAKPEDKVREGKDIELDKPISEEIEDIDEDLEPAELEEPTDEPADEEAAAARAKERAAYDRYLELYEKIKQERDKPIAAQDYEQIKQELEEMAENPAFGRVAAFSAALVDLIERYEAVQSADRMLRERDAELARIRSRIRRELREELEAIGTRSGYVMTGNLARSFVFTAETGLARFAIRDANDNIIAYAEPVNESIREKAEGLIGKEVGLKGTAEPDPNTAKVLVKFTDIAEIWQGN